MNKPIFVIGSPRSGTSILTWCLGQHSNILVQEESDWIGPFALNVEAAYKMGTRRGERSQLGSLNVKRAEFFECIGDAINTLILSHRQDRTRTARDEATATPDSALTLSAFQTERLHSDPKSRWVDGTPEYSFYVCALRKLFPGAAFIHILREVDAVVRSMLNFGRTGGPALVKNEHEAYDYWLRAVRACVKAERAYGSAVVCRIRYSDLVEDPECTMLSLLSFLQEPFEAACLDPLHHRINSSNVPSDFQSAEPRSNQHIIEEAHQLEQQLINAADTAEPSAAAADELESEFQERVHYIQNVNIYHRSAVARVTRLEKELEDLRSTTRNRPPKRYQWLRRGQ